MKPDIGISEKTTEKTIHFLTQLLADEMVLYIKYRKCHWNVYGESFMELHKLFQEHYSALELSVDDIAERINKLGGKSIGTMQEFIHFTKLKENQKENGTAVEMLTYLLHDNETIVKNIRAALQNKEKDQHDEGTVDYITKQLQEHEQYAWILRRYLK